MNTEADMQCSGGGRMIFIEGDELLIYWDELWEDHCVTQSELHHIIKDKWSDIHRYTLEELSEKNWHYPSKGELPEKDVECLVRTISGNNFIAMIDSSDNCWCTGEFFGEYLKDGYVACWQYIDPPKH